MSKIKINGHFNTVRGGHRVEFQRTHNTATVMHRGGLRVVTTTVTHKDVGTLMAPISNHVPEQPTNKWKQYLINRGAQA